MYPVAGMCILCDEPQTMFHFIEILGESCHTSPFPPKWELISAPLEREACDLILMDADPSSIDAMTLLGQLKCRQDHRHVAENVGGHFNLMQARDGNLPKSYHAAHVKMRTERQPVGLECPNDSSPYGVPEILSVLFPPR
jgi:hypothetical protein